jgi:hypothetical protein
MQRDSGRRVMRPPVTFTGLFFGRTSPCGAKAPPALSDEAMPPHDGRRRARKRPVVIFSGRKRPTRAFFPVIASARYCSAA